MQLHPLVHELQRRAVKTAGIAQIRIGRDAHGPVQREVKRCGRQRPKRLALFGQPLGNDELAGRMPPPVRDLIAPGGIDHVEKGPPTEAAPATATAAAEVNGNKTLCIERTFQAPIEAVFDAWTSEQVIRRWWQVENHWETTEAEVDLRVGGTVRVVMRDPNTEIEYGGGGNYTEIEPPTRLAFTWTWGGDTRRTLIELEFEETDGVTTVRFTHSGLWDDEAVRAHEDGWGKLFDRLGRTLEAARPEG